MLQRLLPHPVQLWFVFRRQRHVARNRLTCGLRCGIDTLRNFIKHRGRLCLGGARVTVDVSRQRLIDVLHFVQTDQSARHSWHVHLMAAREALPHKLFFTADN